MWRQTGMRPAFLALALSPALFAGANEWTSIGPESGTVLRLTADPRNPATVYAGTCAGVFKSTDSGANWSAANSGLPVPDCFGVVTVDPKNSATVYTASRQGVFKSIDGGAGWSAVSSGNGLLFYLDNANCRWVCADSFAIDPQNSSTLYAAASQIFAGQSYLGRGILKSVDGGATWRLAASGMYNLVAVDPNDGTVYASGYNSSPALSRSADGGASWVELVPGPIPVTGFALDPHTSGTLYYWKAARIFKSTDSGAGWKEIGPSVTGVESFAISPADSSRIAILASRTMPASTLLESFELFTTFNGGVTWAEEADPALSLNGLNTVAPDLRNPDAWYIGAVNGVLKTTDAGAHWVLANSGLRAIAVAQLLIAPDDGTLLARRQFSPAQGVPAATFFRSTDGGATWAPFGQGSPGLPRGVVPASGDLHTLYMVGSFAPYWIIDSAVYKSFDSGTTWSQVWTQPASEGGITVEGFGPLAVDASNADHLYVAASGQCSTNCVNWILQSADGGRTWNASQPSQADGSAFSSLAVDPRNPAIVYGGTYSFGGFTDTSVWKSVDHGSHWSKLASAGYDVNTLLIDPEEPNTIYYADGAVHKSADGGQTWTALLGGGYDLLVLDSGNPATIYAAASWVFDWPQGPHRIMKSVDGGATWSPVAPPLSSINFIATDPRNPDKLYAGTSGGLFVTTVPSAGIRRRPKR